MNDSDEQCRTALHYACLGSRSSIVVRLLNVDAMRTVRVRDVFGYTSLMYAAMRRTPNVRSTVVIVRALIRNGYDGSAVDETDAQGYTPLLMACRCGNWAAARILLEEGHAETRLTDCEYQLSALDWVLRTSSLNCHQAPSRVLHRRLKRSVKVV